MGHGVRREALERRREVARLEARDEPPDGEDPTRRVPVAALDPADRRPSARGVDERRRQVGERDEAPRGTLGGEDLGSPYASGRGIQRDDVGDRARLPKPDVGRGVARLEDERDRPPLSDQNGAEVALRAGGKREAIQDAARDRDGTAGGPVPHGGAEEVREARLVPGGDGRPPVPEEDQRRRSRDGRSRLTRHEANVGRGLGRRFHESDRRRNRGSRRRVSRNVIPVPVPAPAGEEPVSWILHDGPGFRVGMLRLPARHPRWRRANLSTGPIRDAASIVTFPRRATRLDAGRRLTIDASAPMRLPAFLEYRRAVLDPRGDATDFVLLSEELDALSFPSRARELERLEKVPGAAMLRMRLLVAHLLKAVRADPLVVEEEVHALLGDLGGLGAPGSAKDARRRRDLVEETKEALASAALERAPLKDLARHLAVTPAGLVRAFRRVTGGTLHAYRDGLRLASGLERLEAGGASLAATAAELGFASHAHFTGRFRKRFGASPSDVRRHFDGGHTLRVSSR